MPSDLLPVQRKATLPYRIIRIIFLPVLHALFGLQVSGRGNVPTKGNFVLIANHLNWLDSIAILAAFPPEPRIHFLGDPSGLVHHKVQWFLVRATGGYVPVDRKLHGDPRLYEHVNRCLQKGGVVALYPEGEYGTAEGMLQPFKKGFAHFAIDNHVPVLPVALSGTKDLWLRKRVRLIIGEPIDWKGQTVEGLVQLAEERMRELLPAYKDPGGIKLFRKRLTHLL